LTTSERTDKNKAVKEAENKGVKEAETIFPEFEPVDEPPGALFDDFRKDRQEQSSEGSRDDISGTRSCGNT
jgi:hypothetical protein